MAWIHCLHLALPRPVISWKPFRPVVKHSQISMQEMAQLSQWKPEDELRPYQQAARLGSGLLSVGPLVASQKLAWFQTLQPPVICWTNLVPAQEHNQSSCRAKTQTFFYTPRALDVWWSMGQTRTLWHTHVSCSGSMIMSTLASKSWRVQSGHVSQVTRDSTSVTLLTTA